MKYVWVLALVSCVFVAAEEPIPDKTIVSATLDVPHQKGQNLIWCNTFQRVWNELGTKQCGEPLRLAGTPPLEKSLNASKVSENDVDPDSVFITSGAVTPAFLAKLNADLKKRFGENAPANVSVPVSPDPSILAFAFLYKNLAFKTPFDKQIEPLLWNGSEGKGQRIQAFGLVEVNAATSPDLKSQVLIVSEGRKGFIIELVTTSPQDHVFLAQIEPGETLQATVDSTHQIIAHSPRAPFAIQLSDQCLVPSVRVALERVYDEAIGRKIENAKLSGYSIIDARQNIRFKLDEKGAELKSEARIYGAKNGHQPRRIVFDRPFLLYIERAGATNPMLAIWFENPNLFLKGSELKPSAVPNSARPDEAKK